MSEEVEKKRHNMQLDTDTFTKLNKFQKLFETAFKTKYTKSDVVWALLEYIKDKLDEQELLKLRKYLDEAREKRLKVSRKEEIDVSKVLEELKKL